MLKKHYSQEELELIMKNVPDRKGWNFSYMKTESQQVPWEYAEIIKLYLNKEDTVLDVGTGGGERFSDLSELFKSGIGTDIDEEMIAVANQNTPTNVEFFADDEHLKKVPGSFDVILNRHAPYDLAAVSDKLESGGYFITQQVGEKNMRNIVEVIGTPLADRVIAPEYFEDTGLTLVAFMEYDVKYTVLDIESLLFWLNALDMLHAGFDMGIATEDVNLLNKMLEKGYTESGFVTNEHRYLVIAQKLKVDLTPVKG